MDTQDFLCIMIQLEIRCSNEHQMYLKPVNVSNICQLYPIHYERVLDCKLNNLLVILCALRLLVYMHNLEKRISLPILLSKRFPFCVSFTACIQPHSQFCPNISQYNILISSSFICRCSKEQDKLNGQLHIKMYKLSTLRIFIIIMAIKILKN